MLWIIIFTACLDRTCEVDKFNEIFNSKEECEEFNQTLLVPGKCLEVKDD